MNIFDAIVKGIVALIAAVGGPTAVIKLFEAARVRREAKTISDDGHKETHRLLTEELAEQRKLAQAAVAEAAAARKERNAALRERDAAYAKKAELEKQVASLTAALPPR